MLRGPEFLKKKYGDLHTSKEVTQAATRKEKRTGEKVKQRPEDRIQNYLDRFKEITDREDPKLRERGIGALSRVLYDKYVMQEEDIPEQHFEREQRAARELGHGDIELTEEVRNQLAETITREQRDSLETWITYLTSQDGGYPDWFIYWAFRSMLTLGPFDKGKKRFSKRTKTTTAPYPYLNQEALALVLDGLTKKHAEEPLEDTTFEKLYSVMKTLENSTPTPWNRHKGYQNMTLQSYTVYGKSIHRALIPKNLSPHLKNTVPVGVLPVNRLLQATLTKDPYASTTQKMSIPNPSYPDLPL